MRKIWIIRFSDGTIGSCYGTRSGATEIAELRKEDYGGSKKKNPTAATVKVQ